ncbi:hypothetical protein HMI54_014435 [Coelomomyces lativittatus]|nr:hypothetical protein HMI56_001584 [Coelomomyces lativittatus]KAJ1518606.1 hypothetical protein HMI54_014435 [Coelomomyces lativittatus]
MASVQNIEQWHSAVQLFEAGKLDESFEGFSKIADTARIIFNIGVIYQLLERHAEAVKEFNKAVKRDPYFSAAFFLRGISFHILRQYNDSINSFCDALDFMRGNEVIDYSQLGLDYQLYSCEIFYNCALSYYQLGDQQLAIEMMQNARDCKQLPDHDIIDKALRAKCRGFDLFQLPPNLVFKPSASKVEGIKKIDFSGSAKVIAALNAEDNFVEFKGYRALGLHQSPEETVAPSKVKYPTTNYRVKPSANTRIIPRRPPSDSSRTSELSEISQRSTSLSRPASNDSNYIREKEKRPQRPPLSPISFSTKSVGEFSRKGSLSPPYSSGSASSYSPSKSMESYLPSPSKSESSISTKIRVKVNFNEKRLIMVPSNVTFKQLYYKIQEKFDAENFRIFFKDEDGEWMGLCDDDDFSTAVELSSDPGRLELWCSQA